MFKNEGLAEKGREKREAAGADTYGGNTDSYGGNSDSYGGSDSRRDNY